MPNHKLYRCTWETRPKGAIGHFLHATISVMAPDIKTAMSDAGSALRQENLETRNPVSCNGLRGAHLQAAMRGEG